MSEPFYIPPRRKLRWLALDLDKTLAWPTWKPGQTRSVIGDPIPENIEKLREAYDRGYKGIIHTSRHSGDYELIVEWLKYHHLEQYFVPGYILTGKPLATAYVDDKAINSRDDSWVPRF